MGNSAYVAHVGDSRAYLYRDGRLMRLTRDHTRAERMVAEGSSAGSWRRAQETEKYPHCRNIRGIQRRMAKSCTRNCKKRNWRLPSASSLERQYTVMTV